MKEIGDREEVLDEPRIRSFEEFRTTGLLWLINSAVLHPRGFALALHYPKGTPIESILANDVEPIGWEIVGNGSEAWRYDADSAIDQAFADVEALLKGARA